MKLRNKNTRVQEKRWINVKVYRRKGGRSFGLAALMTVALSHFPDHAARPLIDYSSNW
jgi:hypothetical protein